MSAVAHCRELVRTAERHDSYLIGLLLPSPAHRRAWFATRALNVELASVVNGVVADRNKEAAIARLVWWKQSVIDVCGGKPAPAHPVLQELQAATVGAKLARSFLVRIVEARLKEVERAGSSVQFRTLAELEEFGEQVYASLG